MAYQIIADKCTACGSCIDECPQGAIKAGTPYVVVADDCIDCGACESACPNGAAVPGN